MPRKANLDSWISDKPNDRGYYEAKVWMGTKANGKVDRRHVQRKTLAAVRKRVKELERQRDEGKVTKAGKVPTVQEMLERHLTVVLPAAGTAPRTVADYWSKCRNDIFPRWGGQRIDRLLPEHIQDGLYEMQQEGRAASHIRKVHAILHSVYKDQVAIGNVARNPLDRVRAPRAPEPEITALTQAQARSLLAAAEGRPNAARWSVGLSIGLRQGEALGLRWAYVDLDKGWARIWYQLQRLTWTHGCADAKAREMRKAGRLRDEIEKAVQKTEHDCAARHCKKKPCPARCKQHARTCPEPCPADCTGHARDCPQRKQGGLVFRPIKEKRRKRVPLPAELCRILREHRDEQYLRRITADAEWEENDLVFCQWNGRPIDPRRDWGEWRSILDAAGLPMHRLHDMRHTAATIMLEKGVPLAVVKEILGHSDIRVTNRYSHPSEALLSDAASRMDDLLGNGNGMVTGTKSGPAGQDPDSA